MIDLVSLLIFRTLVSKDLCLEIYKMIHKYIQYSISEKEITVKFIGLPH